MNRINRAMCTTSSCTDKVTTQKVIRIIDQQNGLRCIKQPPNPVVFGKFRKVGKSKILEKIRKDKLEEMRERLMDKCTAAVNLENKSFKSEKEKSIVKTRTR